MSFLRALPPGDLTRRAQIEGAIDRRRSMSADRRMEHDRTIAAARAARAALYALARTPPNDYPDSDDDLPEKVD
jgi:hypothetical protein